MVQSRENLLKQIDSLRDMARRARRLSQGMSQADQEMLLRYAEELEESAARLEKGIGTASN